MIRRVALLVVVWGIVSLPQGAYSAAQQSPLFSQTFMIGRGSVQTIAWHPTDDVILVSTMRGAWLYDGLLRDRGHIEDARLATFSPDGSLIAGVDAANRITLWDSRTLARQTTLTGHAARGAHSASVPELRTTDGGS